jgi:hypothetical protein
MMTKPTDAALKFIQPRSDEIGLAQSENLGYDELRASRLHMLHKEQRPHPKLACEAARDFKSLQKWSMVKHSLDMCTVSR